MKGLKIRLIRDKDLQELANVYTKVYKNIDVGEKWTSRAAYKLLSYWFDRQPDLAFVAEWDGKLVGAFVSAVKPWWDGNHLSDGELFVDPKYQQRNIGTELSKKLYAKALKKYNVTRLDAFTFKLKKFPLSWYKSQGFEEVKEWAIISGNLRKIKKKINF